MLKRQDSLSKRLETLSIGDTVLSSSRMQRRHSATQQDLRRSPKLQRRSGSGRFEDSLPVPVLKAHSPVAKELRNSIAVNSSRSGSDTMRRLEDRWQVCNTRIKRNNWQNKKNVVDSTFKLYSQSSLRPTYIKGCKRCYLKNFNSIKVRQFSKRLFPRTCAITALTQFHVTSSSLNVEHRVHSKFLLK